MLRDIKLSTCWEATQPYLLFLNFAFTFTFIFFVCYDVCFCLSSIYAKEERTSKEGNSSQKNSTNEENNATNENTCKVFFQSLCLISYLFVLHVMHHDCHFFFMRMLIFI